MAGQSSCEGGVLHSSHTDVHPTPPTPDQYVTYLQTAVGTPYKPLAKYQNLRITIQSKVLDNVGGGGDGGGRHKVLLHPGLCLQMCALQPSLCVHGVISVGLKSQPPPPEDECRSCRYNRCGESSGPFCLRAYQNYRGGPDPIIRPSALRRISSDGDADAKTRHSEPGGGV